MFDWVRDNSASSTRGLEEEKEVEVEACPHSVLMPRWDAIGDMGKADRATGYKCDACGQDLSKEDGQAALQGGARLFGS